MTTLDTVTVDRPSGELAQALLRRARADCDALLRKVVGTMREPFATMAGYHLGWWNATRSATDGSSGKALRAALVLAAAEACGGDAGDAVTAAAAVELIHNFTLLHDDVMDGDATRRGRPTVWSVWGVNTAIVLGDALHAEAIRLVTDLPDQPAAVRAARLLEEACLDLSIGQFEDCSFEGRQGVTVDAYVRMAAGKTASLMGCSCALGALSANADEATITALEQFGHELGLAFQFVDDLIGIWGDPTVTGKPVGSDLGRRKATLPVVLALNSQSEAADELAALYRTSAAMTQRDIARARTLVEVAGGRRAARRCADERVQAAIAVLPDAVRSEDLIALSQLITRREH